MGKLRFDKPFDVVDALVAKCLSGFVRKEKSTGLIAYIKPYLNVFVIKVDNEVTELELEMTYGKRRFYEGMFIGNEFKPNPRTPRVEKQTEFGINYEDKYYEQRESVYVNTKEKLLNQLQSHGIIPVEALEIEPWDKIPDLYPYQRERRKQVWLMKNEGYSWEQIAKQLNCGMTTAKRDFLEVKKYASDSDH